MNSKLVNQVIRIIQFRRNGLKLEQKETLQIDVSVMKYRPLNRLIEKLCK